MEPLAGLPERAGVDEPGFWPWQDLYADALVSAGRLVEAEAFLVPHERLAAISTIFCHLRMVGWDW